VDRVNEAGGDAFIAHGRGVVAVTDIVAARDDGGRSDAHRKVARAGSYDALNEVVPTVLSGVEKRQKIDGDGGALDDGGRDADVLLGLEIRAKVLRYRCGRRRDDIGRGKVGDGGEVLSYIVGWA
jgi:hypothetical protein